MIIVYGIVTQYSHPCPPTRIYDFLAHVFIYSQEKPWSKQNSICTLQATTSSKHLGDIQVIEHFQ